MKKNILILLIIVFIALPIFAVGSLYLGWSPFIEPKIRAKAIEAAKENGYQLSMSPLRISRWIPPFQIEASAIDLRDEKGELQVQVKKLTTAISLRSIPFSLASTSVALKVRLLEPAVFLTLPLPEEKKEEADKTDEIKNKADTSPASDLPQIALDLLVSDGVVSVTRPLNKNENSKVWMKDLQFSVQSQKLTGGAPIKTKLNGKLFYDHPTPVIKIQGQTPLSVVTDSLYFKDSQVKLKDLRMNLGGLTLALSGQGDLVSGSHLWTTRLLVPDVAKLGEQGLLPPGKWTGGIDAEVKAALAKDKEPAISGYYKIKDFSGALAKPIRQDDTEISGKFALSSEAKFSYDGIPDVENFLIDVDLTALTILKKDLFHKKAGIPFRITGQGQTAEQKLEIKSLTAQLSHIKATLSGLLATEPKKSSRLSFQLHQTDLKGLENILLPLKDYPMQGSAALTAVIAGDLTDPEKLKIVAKPLDFNVSTGINYKDDEKKISLAGPLTAQVSGEIEIAGKDIETANLKGRADFSKMVIVYGDMFNKKAGQDMRLSFAGNKQGEEFVVKTLNLDSFLGQLKTSGSLTEPLKPKLNLTTLIEGLDLDALKPMLKALKDQPVSGQVNGRLNINGVFDPEGGVEKSPLTVNGVLKHQAGTIKFDPKKDENAEGTQPGQENDQASGVKIKAEPLLPDWPVVKNSKIQMTSQIKNFLFDGQSFENINMDFLYDKGLLTGEMAVKKLFSGEFKFSQMKSNLEKLPIYFSGKAEVKGLNLKSAVTWSMPEYKDLIKGFLFGSFKLQAPLPGQAELAENMSSEGQLMIKEFELSTLQLDEKANEIIKKIPGLGKQQMVKTEPIEARFKTSYQFKNGLLKFSNADLVTPDNNQLLANGSFNIDKTLQLKGELFIAGLNFDENIKACMADDQGRVKIPISYQGSITEPQLSYATDIIANLGKSYLKCEAKRQVKKLENKLKKQVNTEIDKTKKKLEEDVKDKIKDKLKDFF